MYKERINDIITQVDRLTDLLEQLLQLARVESSSYHAKKQLVHLNPIISSFKQKWEELAEKQHIQLDFQIGENDAIPQTDPLFIELILDNLVTNAIKYGKNDGFCRIKWDSNNLILNVEDNGIGISSKDLPNIFDHFYRIDSSRSSAIKGKGLGLSIVKKLADLADIQISIKSEPLQGTQFTLVFPI